MYDEENNVNSNQTEETVNDNQNSNNETNGNVNGNSNSEQSGSYYNSGNTNNNGQGSYYNSGNNSYYNQSNNSNNGYDNSNSGYNNYNNGYNNYNDNNKKPKKNKTAILISCIAGVVVVLAVGVSLITGSIAGKGNNTNNILSSDNSSKKTTTADNKDIPSVGSTDVIEDTNSGSDGKVVITDVSDVVSDVMNSVVAITNTTLVQSNYYDNFSYFYGYGFGNNDGNNNGQSYEEQSAGSGIIVEQTDTELLVVTNNHVVEGADSLSIQFVDGESVEGSVKGTDTKADVAVVAIKLSDIKESTLKTIKKATLGNSDEVTVGEGVIAIGNALGYGQSVTSGIISAKDREVTFDNNNTMKLLQTDAAINGGNSGGALINAKGEVIGINVAKYSSSSTSSSASVEGMGFAIPISSVTDIINNLEQRETRTKVSSDEKGYLEIQGYSVTSDAVEQYSMPEGVYVYAVTDGAAAAKAGIVATDVIVGFDGQTVNSMDDLQSILEYYKAGETVTVKVAYRDGRDYKEKDVSLTLSSSSEAGANEQTTK